MQVSSNWRTASLIAGALLIGSLVGPPLAQAASAALIRIEGANSTHVAAVSKSGQLSVNAGLTTTPAGQVKVALNSPANAVVVTTTSLKCSSGGVYKVPAGKALIISSVNFDLDAVTPSAEGTGLILLAGPVAHPCTSTVASAFAPVGTDFASVDQVYPSGIPIPAGDALGLAAGVNDGGLATIYGYLVPAAAVPHNALQHMAKADLTGVKSRH